MQERPGSGRISGLPELVALDGDPPEPEEHADDVECGRGAVLGRRVDPAAACAGTGRPCVVAASPVGASGSPCGDATSQMIAFPPGFRIRRISARAA